MAVCPSPPTTFCYAAAASLADSDDEVPFCFVSHLALGYVDKDFASSSPVYHTCVVSFNVSIPPTAFTSSHSGAVLQ